MSLVSLSDYGGPPVRLAARNAIGWLSLALLTCAIAHPASAQGSPILPAQSAGTEYRINPGDELEIYVWGEERLQRKVRVLPDGSMAFPLVGQLVAQGDRPADLEAKITQGLRSQYRGEVPQVTVSVVNPAGLQFTVVGKVNAPGTFTPGRFVNVLEALSMAGGPAQFANLNNILVIRKMGTGLQTYRLDVSPLFKGGSEGDIDLRNLATVQTGDTIIVD